uniref:NADH-ubiquinone oxidoreductase chain 2 n=1 Tax=Velarifictorus hemelytrus TaxID=1874760 RepID=A0A1B1SHM9_9ORTH|nr:NADH dehydrogenase subunit 2 [Velarifictorus hemelytrus]ANU83242.1 NADH dehydrogenase subunit 2 [Velarifictorus hemelytrus]
MSIFNPSKLLFMMMLFLGTMISISSNSWPATWMGLEINLMAFIPLMSFKDNMLSTEAAMKYFIIQAMASSLMLTFIIFNFIMPFFNEMIINLIISLTLLLKMGAAPFHMWFPSVMEGLSWMNCFILMTWQKLAPFIILSYLTFNQSIMMFVMLSSIFIGSIGGLNQTSTRKIMAYSSINHIGWMLSAMMMSENMWLIYFWLYIILSSTIILLLNNMSSQHLNQIPLSWKLPITKFILSINLMSMGGLPPFLGFLPKWIIIQNSFYSNMQIPILLMILCTLITLFYYIRMMMTSFMINNIQLKWNQSSKMYNFYLISFLTSTSLFTLPLYPLMF